MNLNELVPAPSASKVNQLAKRVFGYALDLDNLSETKAQRLHKNLSEQMAIYESKLGSASQTRTKYYEMKIALEALTKHIAEKKAKPDYIDIDGDGDKEESMKKAAKDKKEKTNERYGSGPGGKRSASNPQPTQRIRGQRSGSMSESVVTEGAVESSELIMAAKSMVDKYDAMIQDVGEMLNEELAPVADKIRDEMGSDIADQFVAGMTGALQNTLDTMKNDRVAADNATRVLVGDAPAEPMGMDMDTEIAADEMDMEPIEDEFAAAPAAQGGEEAPVGREKRA
jgi:hypothetical protein